jgi:hypothetical protein
MGFNKKFFTTGGIVASTPSAAAFDPLQNFETVTYTGNGSTQKITGYIRKGAAFNGSSSYVSASIPFLNAKVSSAVSLWIRYTDTGAYRSVFNDYSNTANFNHNIIVNQPSTGNVRFFSAYGGNTGYEIIESNGLTLNDGNWHHIVSTVDLSTNTLTGYVDGVSVGNVTVSTNSWTGTTQNLQIGRQESGSYFNGSVDQVRIFNTALNSTQVGQLALEDYTDPKKSTTDYFGNGSGVALYELDEDANGTVPSESLVETNQLINLRAENYTSGSTWTDISGQNNNATLTNPTKPTTESVHFDYADLGAQNQYGGNNVSIEFFIKTTNTDDDYFLTAYNAGGLISGEMLLYIPSSAASGKPYLRVSGSTSSSSQLAFNHTVVQGEWTHYVLVYDSSLTGNTNRFIMYVNGVEVTTSVIGGVDSFDNSNFMGDTSTLFIGKRGGGTDYEEMDIKEFRIYSKSLSSQEVAQNYAASAFKYNGTPTSVNFLGMAFQPDLVWIKQRTGGGNNSLFDSIRGIEKYLISNSTIQETDFSGVNGLISFDANGFTVDDTGGLDYSVNHSGDYVAWCWKAGGAEVSGTSSHYTNCEISANPDAGFSIVNFTVPSGTIPTTASYNHGLNAAPKLIITKPYNGYFGASSWYTWAEPITTSNYLLLNTSDASAAGAIFSSVDSSTVKYRFASNNGGAASDVITYNFTDVDGYQRIGSYQGSGSSGKRVYTTDDGTSTGIGGFQPRFVLIKRATGGAGEWLLYDSMRETTSIKQDTLAADSDRAENTNVNYEVEFESNGFSLDGTSAGINGLNDTYIYLAIA